MAELEVDQSPLPQVQDVCQCFAVLEDGALAHNLQEQEIEQYYSSNVQKNLLVQNDIRTAKRLQDEEEQRAQQLEEQDSRYAQMIQEEIERRAEEARMREEEDEEIARRLQEEEEMEVRQQRLANGHRDTNSFPLAQGMTQGRAAASLDLGALHQVLLDEELARRLQEEEEKLLVMSPQSSPSVKNRDLEGDFRVAQVAQDEEIAHYMQHQERKSRRWSRDLEGLEPCSEHRELDQAHERMVPETLRGRLDSEGLNSPVEDCSPERQSASPVCTTLQQQAVRNIAEELDPTFRANRRGSNSTRQAPGNCETSLSPQCSVHNYMLEPAFVPPTKRQSDKLERPKAKEKICKQQ